MTPEQTRATLVEASKQAAGSSVLEWLAHEGINEVEFAYFLSHITAEASSKLQPKALIGMGFGLGWAAHQVMLATPVEAGPAPDLSDSLE